jgi:hypothetical protein
MDDKEQDIDELLLESEFEYYSNTELIASAYNALVAMSEYDPMTSIGQAKKKRIQRRAINIIDKCIEELHDFITDEDNEDE